jgi:hypothetical protein
MIRLRLIRKFAERLNNVDLSKWQVGDVLELSDREAQILIAAGWGEIAIAPTEPRSSEE